MEYLLTTALILAVGGPTASVQGNVTARADQEAEGTAVGVVLKITPTKTVFTIGEPIEITFRLVNLDRGFWTIFPRIRPEGRSPSHSPQSEIVFVIQDAEGRTVPYVGRYDSFSIPPPVNSGLHLLQQAFFGRTVRIDEGPFAYELGKPGLYSVRAEFRHEGARSWIRRRLEFEGLSESDLSGDVNRVLEDTLTSDPIEIELRLPE